MSDKKIISILVKILDKIQEDSQNARKVEEPVMAICKEESISFEQVFYILFFDSYLLAFKVENSF